MTSVDAERAETAIRTIPGSGQKPAHSLLLRAGAEVLGTFLVVLAGAGVVMFTNTSLALFPGPIATGLATIAAMYALGRVSGGHFNPVLTLASAVAGRSAWRDAIVYLLAQLVGALGAALALAAVLRNIPGIKVDSSFRFVAAGYAEHSPFSVQLPGVLLVEIVGAAVLAAVYLAASKDGKNRNIPAAAVSVGLALAVLGQFAQGLSNSQFNPVRALATAIFAEPWALEQQWLFWVAPLAGALLTGMVARLITVTGADLAAAEEVRAAEAGLPAEAGTGVVAQEAAQETVVEEAPQEKAESARAAAEHEEARDFFDKK
ncbi:aquaporin [Arthrobacter sp. Y-9]|uniref:MIP/aquaporin family protein n=1 Tax=Arthrobacter sp. Y-9 TaxID=3039385 RepID=UPI00241D0758|nr:aquaporin [Arthrobacter sp. Y-9]WFR82981.1 aquaporin [Arthrobacter sp. Y-9]